MVLAGISVYSATFTDWFATERRRRIGNLTAAAVVLTGFAIIAGAIVIMTRGSLHAAVLTVPITVATGLVIAGGVVGVRRITRQREISRVLREMKATR